jgi:hypothetical protein
MTLRSSRFCTPCGRSLVAHGFPHNAGEAECSAAKAIVRGVWEAYATVNWCACERPCTGHGFDACVERIVRLERKYGQRASFTIAPEGWSAVLSQVGLVLVVEQALTRSSRKMRMR